MSDRNETVCGSIEDMGSLTFPTFDAMAKFEDNKGQVVLLGIGVSTYYWRIKIHESLFNSHHMNDNGVVVQDKSSKCSDQQYIIICIQLGTHLFPLCLIKTSLK